MHPAPTLVHLGNSSITAATVRVMRNLHKLFFPQKNNIFLAFILFENCVILKNVTFLCQLMWNFIVPLIRSQAFVIKGVPYFCHLHDLHILNSLYLILTGQVSLPFIQCVSKYIVLCNTVPAQFTNWRDTLCIKKTGWHLTLGVGICLWVGSFFFIAFD